MYPPVPLPDVQVRGRALLLKEMPRSYGTDTTRQSARRPVSLSLPACLPESDPSPLSCLGSLP